MPTYFADFLTNVSSVSLTFMTSVIQTYWAWILGLVVLVALARRFKRLVGLAR